MAWQETERHIVLSCPYWNYRTWPPSLVLGDPSYIKMEWKPDQDGMEAPDEQNMVRPGSAAEALEMGADPNHPGWSAPPVNPGPPLRIIYPISSQGTKPVEPSVTPRGFANGDRVRLVSGGPLMTVDLSGRTDGIIDCCWFDLSGMLHREAWPPEMLCLSVAMVQCNDQGGLEPVYWGYPSVRSD